MRIIMFIVFFVLNSALPKELILSWNPNPEPDVAGYRIYEIRNSKFVPPINVGKVVEYNLGDRPVGECSVFRVSAYDFSNNESLLSDPVTAYESPTGELLHVCHLTEVFSAAYDFVITSSVMHNDTAVVSDSTAINFGWKQDAKLIDDTPVPVDSLDGWKVWMDDSGPADWSNPVFIALNASAVTFELKPEVYRVTVQPVYHGIEGQPMAGNRKLLVMAPVPSDEPDYSTRTISVTVKINVKE